MNGRSDSRITRHREISRYAFTQNVNCKKTGYPSERFFFKHDWRLIIDGKEQNYDFKTVFGISEPNNSTWKCIKSHHKETWTPEVGILRIADRLASAFSRSLTPDEIRRQKVMPVKKGVHKLWNPDYEKSGLNLLSSPEEIQGLIKFVNLGDFESFVKVHDPLLNMRPEDFSPPNNIVSLKTHLILVGKFYRIFENNLKIEDNFPSFEGKKANSLKDAENKWKLKIVRCKVGFPQKPVRVKDLKILLILKEKMDAIKKRDQAFPFSSDEFLLVLPSKDRTEDILKIFTEAGFFVEITSVEASIGTLSPNPQKIIAKYLEELKTDTEIVEYKKEIPEHNRKKLIFELQQETFQKFDETRLYWDLSSQITPEICEVCQMAHADVLWSNENEQITENICARCSQIRTSKEVLKKLASWSDEPEIQVYWLKIRLVFDELLKILEELYSGYLNSIGLSNLSPNLTFSVFEEFHQDFNNFLVDFNEKLKLQFSELNVERPIDDLFIIKREKSSVILSILASFNDCFNRHFPEFKRIRKSPIRLAITISGVKFPFLEHWRLLNNSEKEISVIFVTGGQLSMNVDKLDELLNKTIKIILPNRTLLHRLSDMANVSEALARIELFEHEEKLRLPADIDFESIKALVKILDD